MSPAPAIKPLCFSDEFVISCGMVTLDLRFSKVLLVRWRETGEFLLPKGRKNIGETLEDAALRETFEETGYQPTLLSLPLPTLATPAEGSIKPTAGSATFVTEPIAVQQRLSSKNELKIIFWFAGQADSTAVQELGTQKEDENFETWWIDVTQIDEVISFDDDKQIANKVVEAARNRL